jgi:succinyl-CoA synthetase beta subunit
VDAANEVTISVPIVVRLEGTKVDEGKAIIKESSLDIISASDLLDAANKAVQSIKNN